MRSPEAFDPRDQDAYDALQARLVPLWSSLDHLNTDEQTIVVVPSADVDVELSASQLQAYEERFLFLLFLLRQPRARMVFVTGQRIAPEIVDYYMDLLPGVIQSNARKRLFFVSPMEARFRPLSRKLLDRPHIVEEIKALIPNRDRAHLVPFMTTWDDRELAMRLGIPMYGADPAQAHLGTKSEGRRLFSAAGVRHPRGTEGLHTRDEAADAIADLIALTPAPTAAVLKLDEGVSGFGNATIDLTGLRPHASREEIGSVLDRLPTHEAIGDVDSFFRHLSTEGGVVEEMVTGSTLRSPSVQLRITPVGNVELLSTHDQILGGPSGQVFMGSRFPADLRYARQISASAARVGERLASTGVIGRFAIDYVVVEREDGSWDNYAIELNLRKGGTTHPFLTLQFLTDGTYDPERAVFVAPDGVEKYYVASDHVEIEGLEVLRPQDLLDLALLHDLHFDQTTLTGVVFHMLSAMPTHGLVGVTCIENSADAAAALYDRVISFLAGEAERLRP
ncbi:MAG: peptide ligase PGM1-related protein [Acidimicrobiia bacterium]